MRLPSSASDCSTSACCCCACGSTTSGGTACASRMSRMRVGIGWKPERLWMPGLGAGAGDLVNVIVSLSPRRLVGVGRPLHRGQDLLQVRRLAVGAVALQQRERAVAHATRLVDLADALQD